MKPINKNPYVFPFLWMKGEGREVIAEEIEKIYQTGIREICIESRPHPHFLENPWWQDMDFVMEEAKKRDMKVWLLDDAHFPTGYANGLIKTKYPERKKKYLAHNVIDLIGKNVPVEIPIGELIKPMKSWRDTGKKEDKQLQDNQLVSVTAFEIIEGDLVSEKNITDIQCSAENDYVEITLPQGAWRLVVVYETSFNGGNPDYINIIDRKSVSTLIEAVYEPHYQRYMEEFGKTFAGFFSDEPGFGNTMGFDKDERIGHKNMVLPWSQDVKDSLIQTYGDYWKSYLPFLWSSSVENDKCVSMRLCYMDIVTLLYQKNFSEYLGSWCRERNVEYVGHVIEDNNQHTRLGSGSGHYFRSMSGQSISGIDTIGCQIIPGGGHFTHSNKSKADGEFFHYALTKLADSSAILDENKKGRALAELFGAYGWKLGLRDMFWITNHLLARGITYFVPHAFSMAEYPDLDCPPHFYARGNNPQYSYFHQLINYMRNLSSIFQDTKLTADIAILYHAESEWMGEYMTIQKPARELTQNQLDYLFVTNDMLKEAASDKQCFSINNHNFRYLLIPYSQFITETLMDFIKNNSEISIYFIDGFPDKVVGNSKAELFYPEKNCQITLLEKLPEIFYKSERPITIVESPNVVLRQFGKDENTYCFVFNESLIESAEVLIEANDQYEIGILDFTDYQWKRLLVEKADKKIKLNPHEAVLLIKTNGNLFETYDSFDTGTNPLDISSEWQVSTVRAIDYPNFDYKKFLNKLIPISKIIPDFSGIIRYEKIIDLQGNERFHSIEIENVYESCRVWIDEQYIGEKCAPPYIIFSDLKLTKGEHKIVIEVATTLDREQRTFEKTSILPIFEPSDPTGIFGTITLNFC